jgi:hypothetical protein
MMTTRKCSCARRARSTRMPSACWSGLVTLPGSGSSRRRQLHGDSPESGREDVPHGQGNRTQFRARCRKDGAAQRRPSRVPSPIGPCSQGLAPAVVDALGGRSGQGDGVPLRRAYARLGPGAQAGQRVRPDAPAAPTSRHARRAEMALASHHVDSLVSGPAGEEAPHDHRLCTPPPDWLAKGMFRPARSRLRCARHGREVDPRSHTGSEGPKGPQHIGGRGLRGRLQGRRRLRPWTAFLEPLLRGRGQVCPADVVSRLDAVGHEQHRSAHAAAAKEDSWSRRIVYRGYGG